MTATRRHNATVLVAFTLSMPGRASWNGRWSGDDRSYVLVRHVPTDRAARLAGKSFGYAWSDGWCASVDARIVDSREAVKLRRKSDGFNGYDWMVDSLVIDGRILTWTERAKETESARTVCESGCSAPVATQPPAPPLCAECARRML